MRLCFSNCLRFIFPDLNPSQSESSQSPAPSASESSLPATPRDIFSAQGALFLRHRAALALSLLLFLFTPSTFFCTSHFLLSHPPSSPRVARDSQFPSVVECALDYGYGYT
ncbi:hypothetical protein B0H13DRAFT_2331032 [Mycena leptocephala]|nr:hypothetical protein B0H13DRAFT_2331032 [Mycena leptocephala]